MNYTEFMLLPPESRKRIEATLLNLDKAVQDAYGFSMLDGDLETIAEVGEQKDGAA